ncbi:hypothetical protein ACHAXS_005278 [Conticribra weissflogii]
MSSLSSSSTAIHNLPPRTKAALHHLQALRPLDGFSVDNFVSTTGKTLWRLKRRGVPLSDDGFLEIVVVRDGTTATATASSGSSIASATAMNCEGCTVGIQVLTSKGDAGRGIILVNPDGSVAGHKEGEKVVTVSMADTLSNLGKIHTSTVAASRDKSFSSSMRGNDATNRPPTGGIDDLLANISNDKMVQYAFLALGGLVALKMIFSVLLGGGLGIVLLPVLYYYALQHCPSSESFDAKRELKRVMRGTHLPEDQQPKGFFEQGLNRLAASISTELATSLGYECEITDYFGAAKMAFVRVPVAGADFYWIGIFGELHWVLGLHLIVV